MQATSIDLANVGLIDVDDIGDIEEVGNRPLSGRGLCEYYCSRINRDD